MDDIHKILKASQVGMQSLERLTMLVTVNEPVGLVCVRGLLTLCLTLLDAVCRNQPVVPRTSEHNGKHFAQAAAFQALEPDDHPRRAGFATEMLLRIDEDSDYLMGLPFTLRGK